jgi:D-glycero-D-manno-heptose 1,7-bisphosphate phosphatase
VVAAGHKSLEDAIAEMRFCLQLLPQIDSALLCPDFEGNQLWKVEHPSLGRGDVGICDNGTDIGLYGQYRKPAPGMLNYASELYPEAIMIGDRPEDRDAAAAAGIPFVDAEAWRSGAVVIAPGAIIA